MLIQVFGRAMKFLRAEHQVDVRQLVDEFLPAALRHATHETENDVGRACADVCRSRFCILLIAFCSAISRTLQVLSKMTSARRLGWGQGIALGDELSGDRFAVALVHLATVGLNENTGHTACNRRRTYVSSWY